MSATDTFLIIVYAAEIAGIAAIGVWMLVKLYRHLDDEEDDQ